MPVIVFLSSGSQQSDVWRLVEFRRGLSETGYVEGRDVMGHFSWAAATGHGFVVDVDLEKFFDRVNHDVLMGLIAG